MQRPIHARPPEAPAHHDNVVSGHFRRRSSLHQKFSDDLRVVKRARFNAAVRHERQEKATTTAFAIAGIFGFVIPYFLLSLEGALPRQVARIIELTALLSGGLSLVLGLIERGADHQDRARRFHQCGLDVNRLLRHLEAAELHDDSQLRSFHDAYDSILRACGLNHARIDMDMARGGDGGTMSVLGMKMQRITYLRWRLGWHIHGAYISVCVLPMLLGLALVVLLPAA